MKPLILTALSAALFLFACRKAEDLNNVLGNPVFTATFQLDTQSNTLTAGVNGIYLFTRSGRDTPQQAYLLSGSFAPADCPGADCPGTFSLFLRAKALLDSTFIFGNYRYYWPDDPDTLAYLLEFDAMPGFPGSYACTWLINKDSAFDGPSATYTTNTQDLVRVLQQVNRSDGYYSRIERFVAPSGFDFCPNVDIQTMKMPGDSALRLLAVPSAGSNLEFQWSTGSTEILIDIQPAPAAAYSVTVTDTQTNCTASASLSLLNWMPDLRTANFKVATTTFDPRSGNTAALEWLDAAGVSWSSARGPQPAWAYFQITKAEPFEKNERGEPTRKLHIRYECRVYNDDGAWKALKGEAVTAVGWPAQ